MYVISICNLNTCGRAFAGEVGRWMVHTGWGLGINLYIFGGVIPSTFGFLELNLLSGIYTNTLDPDKPDKNSIIFSDLSSLRSPPPQRPPPRDERKERNFFGV